MKDPETNRVCGVRTVQVDEKFQKIEGTDKVWDVDLVILALGFLSPEQNIVDSLGLATDARGNILAHYQEKGGFRAMSRRHGMCSSIIIYHHIRQQQQQQQHRYRVSWCVCCG